VDHPIASHDLVRPWRTATVVATGVAVLELVLLVIAGLVLLGREVAPHVQAAAKREALAPKPAVKAAPAARKHHRSAPARPRLTRAHTGVLVLNGNGIQGAAAEAAALAKARGYLVKRVGNAPRAGYPHTIVMYRPRFRAEALRFGRDLSLRVVVPLDGMKPAQLHGAHLVLVLGASR
jgi:LytR cell envelope-related transcriptional attenuator